MRYPRLVTFLTSALLAVSAVAAEKGQPAVENFRLGDAIVPTAQAIDLELDAAQSRYRGAVTVELEARKEARVFHFHAEGLEIRKLALSRDGEPVAVEHAPQGENLVAVTAAEPLVPGAYLLAIDFENDFDTQAVSLYRAEVEGESYAFTQFQADDAREAFPCWDEPHFKIPYQVTLRVPEAHLALTNTPVATSRVEDGWRISHFEPTPPLPSYLLAMATGPLEFVEMPGLGVPGRLVTVRGRSELTSLALEVTPQILKALEAYFGSPYPFAKLDFIAVPEFWPGAMENPGAVTYAERLLVMDPASVTVAQRRAQARVIAHELAHMWFGDLVTMEWWDDLWLNESFADWMADKITHQLFPELAADIAGIQSGHRIMLGDALETAVAIRRPVKATTANLLQDVGLAYAKGKMVLGMFERWLGEETFRKGVLDYMKAHEWGNATAEDLFAALTETSDAPIAEAMATFIDQPGVPRIEVEPLGEGRYRVSQTRYRLHGTSTSASTADAARWKVPLRLRYRAKDETAVHSLLLDAPSRVIDLGGEALWLHPNAGAGGYYRWSLPADSLRRLAAAGDALEPVERINLIGNSAALLQAGEIDGGAFLGILTDLAQDPHPAVVSAALSELGLVEAAFVPESLKPAYGVWLRQTLAPSLERFGAAEKSGEPETVTLLRPQLMSRLAEHEHRELVADLAAKGKAFLADPTSVDPTLAPIALRVLAREHGDAELWEEIEKRASEATIPRLRGLYLGTLSAFDAPALRERTLAYSLSPAVRPNELFIVVGGLFRTAEGRDLVFTYMTEHWQELIAKLPPHFRAFMPRLADGCSSERLARAEAFFTDPEHAGPGMEQTLARVTESVTSCVALRERESAAVATFLEPYIDEAPADEPG